MLKVGLLGFGTVGSGTYEILAEREKEISKIVGDTVKVTKVLVKDRSEVVGDFGFTVTEDYKDIIEDPEIALVCELTGAKELGYKFIKEAMENKKHVVTANKAVVSKYFEEFKKIAKEKDVAFLYEASVGGAVPIIAGTKAQSILNKISEVRGILNGTCNYLLYKMFTEESDYAETLKICQELGYAEADPTDDVEGFDTMRKLRILSSLAYGSEILEEDIELQGISAIKKEDVRELKGKNKVVKLLAFSKVVDNKYMAVVEPTILDEKDAIGAIPLAINTVSIKGNNMQELQFSGPGAGKLPTGNAVVNDIMDALSGKYYNDLESNAVLNNNNQEFSGKYYIRAEKGKVEIKSIEKNCDDNYDYIYTDEIKRTDLMKILEDSKVKDYFFARIDS